MTRPQRHMLAVFALLWAALAAAFFGPPARAAEPGKPLKLYDWMGYHQQPDIRPLGYRPLYGLMDGTYNRATVPEAVNVPGINKNAHRSLFAARRQARAALGIEPLGQDAWKLPPAYAGVHREVIIDLESPALLDLLDQTTATSRDRIKAIDTLCQHVDEMQKEAGYYGRKLRFGAYLPSGWVGRHTWPGDPAYHAYDRAGRADWKPYVDRLSFVAPELTMAHADVERCQKDADERIRETRRVVGPKVEVYADLALVYWDFSPEGGKLVPLADWSKYVTFLAHHPEVDGVVLFGHDAQVENPTGVGRRENVSFRLDFRFVKAHVDEAARIVEAANRRTPPAK